MKLYCYEEEVMNCQVCPALPAVWDAKQDPTAGLRDKGLTKGGSFTAVT